MSGPINDGGPAFPPTLRPNNGCNYVELGGMTLRDWFAGQALATLSNVSTRDQVKAVANMAYALADALLAARAKGGDQ